MLWPKERGSDGEVFGQPHLIRIARPIPARKPGCERQPERPVARHREGHGCWPGSQDSRGAWSRQLPIRSIGCGQRFRNQPRPWRSTGLATRQACSATLPGVSFRATIGP